MRLLAMTWGDIGKSVDNAGTRAWGQTTAPLPVIIGNIINIGLGLFGVVFLGLALWAGYNWMTAGGEEEKIETAKNTLKNAVLGMVLIMCSYALTTFIMDSLISTTQAATGG